MPKYTYTTEIGYPHGFGEDARITRDALTVRCGDGLCGLLNPVPRCEACKKRRGEKCWNFVTLTRTVRERGK